MKATELAANTHSASTKLELKWLKWLNYSNPNDTDVAAPIKRLKKIKPKIRNFGRPYIDRIAVTSAEK